MIRRVIKRLLRTARRHLPRAVRWQIYRVGAFVGDEFAPRSALFGDRSSHSISDALATVRDWGFRPQTIVDVGAFRGDWTRLAKEVFPAAHVLMIEPQDALLPFLDDVSSYYPHVSHASVLLGADDGTAVEFVETASGTGSSVLEETSHVPRWKVAKQTITLDTLAAERGIATVDLIKLDVQGYELEVLRGASRTLAACELVLMETSVIAVNRGCPLIADVFPFMSARGFRLLDICSHIRRKDGALWQTDLLFVNERSALVPAPELNPQNW